MTVVWDATFLANPEGSDDPRQGDDAIRELRRAVDERVGREHYGKSTETNADHGMHKQGSAVAFCQAAAPTTSVDGGALSATLDLGRLWVDTDTDMLYYYNGSAFVGAFTSYMRCSVQGVLAAGTAVVPPIHVPRGMKVTKVSARVGTAPTGATLIVDINKNGANSLFTGATRPTIAIAGVTNSVTSMHASYGLLDADDYLTVDIDQVGSTVAGADLSLTLEMRPR